MPSHSMTFALFVMQQIHSANPGARAAAGQITKPVPTSATGAVTAGQVTMPPLAPRKGDFAPGQRTKPVAPMAGSIAADQATRPNNYLWANNSEGGLMITTQGNEYYPTDTFAEHLVGSGQALGKPLSRAQWPSFIQNQDLYAVTEKGSRKLKVSAVGVYFGCAGGYGVYIKADNDGSDHALIVVATPPTPKLKLLPARGISGADPKVSQMAKRIFAEAASGLKARDRARLLKQHVGPEALRFTAGRFGQGAWLVWLDVDVDSDGPEASDKPDFKGFGKYSFAAIFSTNGTQIELLRKPQITRGEAESSWKPLDLIANDGELGDEIIVNPTGLDWTAIQIYRWPSSKAAILQLMAASC